MSDAGVIIESEPEMDGVWKYRGSVLLKGVRGNFLEIFEKSIDKHKIDAILECAVLRKQPFAGCLTVGETRAGGFHGRIRYNHPDTRKSDENGRELSCAYAYGKERYKVIVRFV